MDSEEPPNVRVACSGDIDEVVRLMHDAAAWMSAKGTPAWDVARIDRTFAETFVLRSELLVASCSDGIVGCCTLSAEDPEFWPDALKGEAAYLHKLAVRRTHAGRGVSSALIEACRHAARTQGCAKLRLDCHPNLRGLLLGFRFAPRLRDIGDRKLGSIAAPSTYKGIENLMGRTIKTAAIEADWDDIVRIVASIKDGTVAPSVILRKLAAYKRQNRLDFALAELGRIERTLFTLDWLEQPELRRACQAGLNKGEARHTLAAAIYTNRQGRFTDRSLENQEFRASGLNLLIAAISYWNTVYLDRAAQHLNAVGTTFDAALLAHLSPMGWAHISLTGDYLWEQARRLPAGEFHPLNEPMARLKRVA